MNARYGCDESELVHYTCFRTGHKLEIDGRLDKCAWLEAPKSRRFDISEFDPCPLFGVKGGPVKALSAESSQK